MPDHPLEPIFHPRSIAVVGASPRGPQTGVGAFVPALIEQGYDRDHGLYPINPRAEEVSGLTCYPTLLDCPDPVDHVISQVPAMAVPQVLEQCIEKGVRSLHLFTAGFSETRDDAMREMEDNVVTRAREAGIRVIGPNCMGLYVPEENMTFMDGFPTEAGNVLLLAQSGSNARAIILGLARRGIRFSKVISFGNGADLDSHDFFDYASSDPNTEFVVAYIESISAGRDLLEALKRCARVKPTIILKGGINPAGTRAANSHTGALSGSADIFEALCRQTGAIRAETIDSLQDLLITVSTTARDVTGPGVVLAGGPGGFAVLSADAIYAAGLQVPEMPQVIQEELHEFVPIAGRSVRNPIDTNMGGDDGLRIFRVVAQAEPVDMVFVTNLRTVGQVTRVVEPSSVQRQQASNSESLSEEEKEKILHSIETVALLQQESRVPFVGILPPTDQDDGEIRDHTATLAYERGIAVFPTVERAAHSISTILQWREHLEGLGKFHSSATQR